MRNRRVIVVCCFALFAVASVRAATKAVDLDARAANAAESNVSLNVLTAFPPKVENKVTNKAIGDAFTFSYKSAGPGGFNSQVAAGTATGVGAKWVWQTAQTIYSFTGTVCEKDICFTQTAGPDPVASRGPFSVPGRSLTPSNVTLSSASLTSSLITFFSPPQVLVSVTSSVEPVGGGQFGYTTTYQNNTGDPVQVEIAPGPLGCCPEPNQLNCDGTCVSYLNDPENCGGCGIVCDEGASCSEAECTSFSGCDEGQSVCAEQCVFLDSDFYNCGECGNTCLEGESCSFGSCQDSCGEGGTLCGEGCVNLYSDPQNCGECGNTCGGDNQACIAGVCTPCSEGQTSCGDSCADLQYDENNCGACGSYCPAVCIEGGCCLEGCGFRGGEGELPPIDEAPLCETTGSVQIVPPGGVIEVCQASGFLPKEITSQLTVCGDSIPDGQAVTCVGGAVASQGSYQELSPDSNKTAGDVFLSPYHVQVTEPSGDGLLQPGETGRLRISVLNVGSETLTRASGELSSPPVDLTDDGVDNPVPVDITTASSAYPDLQGISDGDGLCGGPATIHPEANETDFVVSVPADQPGDTARPFRLVVEGSVGALRTERTLDVPLVIGIGSACDPENVDNRFDGLKGLLSPMAKLVPVGDVVRYPKAFSPGNTRPLKLKLLCGSLVLGEGVIDPPQIVGLTRDGEPLDITTLDLNDSANPDDPLFRYSAGTQTWIFNMRTRDLEVGDYVLTIRMATGQEYQTGFVLVDKRGHSAKNPIEAMGRVEADSPRFGER